MQYNRKASTVIWQAFFRAEDEFWRFVVSATMFVHIFDTLFCALYTTTYQKLPFLLHFNRF